MRGFFKSSSVGLGEAVWIWWGLIPARRGEQSRRADRLDRQGFALALDCSAAQEEPLILQPRKRISKTSCNVQDCHYL